jgi:hypothetical protein
LKVVIFFSTLVVVLFTIILSADGAKPYLVYSFEDNFAQYHSYIIKNCSLSDFCGGNAGDLIFHYEASKDFSRYQYIDNLDKQNKTNDEIISQMEKDGLLNNLRAIDLQNNFLGPFYRLLYVIIIPIAWYLLWAQGIYRIFVYVLMGKNKK